MVHPKGVEPLTFRSVV